MTSALPETVVIFTSHPLDPQVKDLGRRRGWSVLRLTSIGQALRAVVVSRPRAIVVHVPDESAAAVSAELVTNLRRRDPRLPLIALVPRHTESTERTLRGAGVGCYLAGGPAQLAGVMRALLEKGEDRVRCAGTQPQLRCGEKRSFRTHRPRERPPPTGPPAELFASRFWSR